MITRLAAFVTLAWALGFAWFALFLPQPLDDRHNTDAIVVLIHQGGRTPMGTSPNDCAGFAGDIQPIIAQLKPGVDVIVSGHTHWAYVCDYAKIDPAHPVLLTSAVTVVSETR